MREESQAAQVLLEVSVELRLAGPQLPVSGAAKGSARARRHRLPLERRVSQFGELSGDGLLSDVILPGQAWKHQRSSGSDLQTHHWKQQRTGRRPAKAPENGEYVTRWPDAMPASLLIANT